MKRTSAVAAKVGLMAGLSGLLLVGCIKQDDFPDEPLVTFKSFEQFELGASDSSSLTIAFTDGDGDVGLNATDNTAPFDTSSVYYHNLFVEYEYLQNGVWIHYEFGEVDLYYRIPRITPTGQNKTLEGEIAVAIKPWPIFGNAHDTVRFSVHMVDRALHESNTVVSGPVVVQH